VNLTEIPELMFCWEGKYTSTGGSSSVDILFYNVSSGSWTVKETVSQSSEGIHCIYFNHEEINDLYNDTSGLVEFAVRGKQSRDGYSLTLYTDFVALGFPSFLECSSSFLAQNSGTYQITVKANNSVGHLTSSSVTVYTCELLKRVSIVKRPWVIDSWKLLVFFNKTHYTCAREALGLTHYGFIFEVRDLEGNLVTIQDVDGKSVPCRFPRQETIPPGVAAVTVRRYATLENRIVVVYLYLWKT